MRMAVIGVDQGGTKAIAIAVSCDGRILSIARGAGLDSHDAVPEVVSDALHSGALQARDIACLVGGLSGADWPHDYPRLVKQLERTTNVANCVVVNDSIAAMRGGTSSQVGAVVCVGTGMNAGAIGVDGKTFLFGYYVAGAHQGAGSLGSKALQAVFDAESGLGPPTALTCKVLEWFGMDDVTKLAIRYFEGGFSCAKGQLKYLTPLLVSCAEEGDVPASEIITSYGEQLVKYSDVALLRVGLNGRAGYLGGYIPLVLSGSVLRWGNFLTKAVAVAVHRTIPKVEVIEATLEPVAGAAVIALGEVNAGQSAIEAFKADCTKWGLCRTPHITGLEG